MSFQIPIDKPKKKKLNLISKNMKSYPQIKKNSCGCGCSKTKKKKCKI